MLPAVAVLCRAVQLPQVYALYAALLLTAFNRLPLRLPTRGPLAGRKHNKGGENSSTPVTFADVAGVDEAKEELQEIVVSSSSRSSSSSAVAAAVLGWSLPAAGSGKRHTSFMTWAMHVPAGAAPAARSEARRRVNGEGCPICQCGSPSSVLAP